jgi:phage-related protein
MDNDDKPLVWLHGEVKTPPFSQEARLEAGFLLRRLQQGENLELPHSRPIPSIAVHCHELRIRDVDKNWRIIYRIDDDAIVIVEVFNWLRVIPHASISWGCKRDKNETSSKCFLP